MKTEGENHSVVLTLPTLHVCIFSDYFVELCICSKFRTLPFFSRLHISHVTRESAKIKWKIIFILLIYSCDHQMTHFFWICPKSGNNFVPLMRKFFTIISHIYYKSVTVWTTDLPYV